MNETRPTCATCKANIAAGATALNTHHTTYHLMTYGLIADSK